MIDLSILFIIFSLINISIEISVIAGFDLDRMAYNVLFLKSEAEAFSADDGIGIGILYEKLTVIVALYNSSLVDFGSDREAVTVCVAVELARPLEVCP